MEEREGPMSESESESEGGGGEGRLESECFVDEECFVGGAGP